jgi:NlpC/P60 family
MTVKTHSRYCQTIGLVLILGALGSLASAEQSNTKVSRADHGTIRSTSVAIAPSLVSPDQGLSIIGAALESRKPTDSNADCSNLVHAIYERAGLTYSYANSSELYRGVKEFQRILDPQPGDLVVWRGHVGIVISPVQHSFFSAMRSGRGVEFYDSPYWQARGRPRFFRYRRVDSRTQFSASTRNANLRPGSSSNVESRSGFPGAEDVAPASGVSSARQATDKRSPARNGDKPVSGTTRSAMVATAGVSRADLQAASPKMKGSQAALPDKSESQTTSDAQGALDANKPTRASHKMQGPEDGVWVKSAAKPSPEIPFDSAVTPTRTNEPQGFRASNITTPAGHQSARSSSAGGPLVNEVKTEPVQWAMSRDVPRPPWSSRSGGTTEALVPRPPAKRIPHTSSAY